MHKHCHFYFLIVIQNLQKPKIQWVNIHVLVKWKTIFGKSLLVLTVTCKHLLIYTDIIVSTYLSHIYLYILINEKIMQLWKLLVSILLCVIQVYNLLIILFNFLIPERCFIIFLSRENYPINLLAWIDETVSLK